VTVRRRPSAITVFGFSVAVGLVLLRLAAVFVDTDPALLTDRPMLGPSWAHPLGTDPLGRDLLARMIVSSEAFFLPGLFACSLAVLFAVPAGAAIGYWPRAPASAAVRATLTIVGAWPRLVVVVVVVAIFTASVSDPAAFAQVRLFLLAGLVGLSFVPQMAYSLAERVLFFQREQFVEAARAHGLGDARILGFHILWANCRNLVLRQVCTLFGAWLLVETSLSYLGHYGVPAPRPSWGNMLSDVRFSVIHTRRLLIPEAWTPSGILQAIGLAIEEGGALAVAAPTLAVAVSIGGVLALGEHFARKQEGW
jgi:peptide/nickel transport system permease protein